VETMLLRLFQRQVADQCRGVLVATPPINAAVASGDQDTLWVSIQNLVTGSANISKALWGQGHRYAKARERLRASLDVQDDSPLSDVSMRNHFEHYDERLDHWWATSANRNHLDRLIGPPSAVAGFTDEEMFRVFDPTTSDLVFWGQRFNVQAVVTEVERIHPLALQQAALPHWDEPK